MSYGTLGAYYKDKIQTTLQDGTLAPVLVSLDFMLLQYIADTLFDGDLTRVQWASTAYAFRDRTDNNTGNLNLPFASFKTTPSGMNFNNDRAWNHTSVRKGVYIPEFQDYVRLIPVQVDYEATFWCAADADLRVAAQKLLFSFASSSKTLPYYVKANEHDFKLIAHFTSGRNIDYAPEYNEQDWLEQNRIQSIGFDFSVMTFLPDFPADVEASITETAILKFGVVNDIGDYSQDQIREIMVDQFTN